MAKIPMVHGPKKERVAVLISPRTKADLIKVAWFNQASVNLIINDAIAKYLEEHQNDIQRYNDFFGEE